MGYLPLTRQEAIERSATEYFPRVACKRNHMLPHSTRTGRCKGCEKQYNDKGLARTGLAGPLTLPYTVYLRDWSDVYKLEKAVKELNEEAARRAAARSNVNLEVVILQPKREPDPWANVPDEE